ncbi:sortase [Dactylosporangium siamense]|uniref:Sortase n=1 Tax=Dactylosporangium siamense TaxID=685454 RepID=A0A919U9A8_9ACTN|nr:sortase [Dactylosporangium siamense]GIG43076.1 sortase [Dactylosporangium siamense]
MTATAVLESPADDDDDFEDLLPEPVVLTKLPPPAAVTVVVRSLLTLAVLSGWLVAYALGVSAVQQARTQQQLYNDFREKLALATVPIGGEIDPGTPVALIEAPGIGLRQIVVEGTSSGVMRDGPGHRRDTALPGQPGTSVVYGHAAAFGGPFRRVTELQPGDPVTATSGLGVMRYEVTGVRRESDPLPAPLPSGGARLTLVTAEADGWRSGWAPNRVVYVDAVLKSGDVLPGHPGRPRSVAVAEKAMQADPDALVPLVFWLQVFVAAALATTWARQRWGGLQTWFVGAPILLACLWGTVETLAEFLPNLS